MKQFLTFTKKELLEQLRTGKLLILTILFILFGIMNPAMAKLTPWIMEISADRLAESGMILQKTEVNALTSWAQFFKNMPIALIIFIVMSGNIFTTEYQTGTLINVVTKGMKRYKILAAKTIVMALLWTLEYLLAFGITYVYTAYFWDESIVRNVAFASFSLFLAGLWLISIIPLASCLTSQSFAVLLTTGAAFLAAYLFGMLPDCADFSPSRLFSSPALLTGEGRLTDYTPALVTTSLLLVLNTAAAVIFFNKKSL